MIRLIALLILIIPSLASAQTRGAHCWTDSTGSAGSTLDCNAVLNYLGPQPTDITVQNPFFSTYYEGRRIGNSFGQYCGTRWVHRYDPTKAIPILVTDNTGIPPVPGLEVMGFISPVTPGGECPECTLQLEIVRRQTNFFDTPEIALSAALADVEVRWQYVGTTPGEYVRFAAGFTQLSVFDGTNCTPQTGVPNSHNMSTIGLFSVPSPGFVPALAMGVAFLAFLGGPSRAQEEFIPIEDYEIEEAEETCLSQDVDDTEALLRCVAEQVGAPIIEGEEE